MFSCEYCNIYKSTYLTEHLQTAASVFYKIKTYYRSYKSFDENVFLIHLHKLGIKLDEENPESRYSLI